VSAIIVGSNGAMFLAEDPRMFHRLRLQSIDGRDSLTMVWNKINDNVVATLPQGNARVLVAGSSIRFQTGTHGDGALVNVENPSRCTMSPALRYLERSPHHELLARQLEFRLFQRPAATMEKR
jgi:hypothetical protein